MILRGKHHLGSDLYPSSTHQFLPLIAPFIFSFLAMIILFIYFEQKNWTAKKKKNWRKQEECLGVRAAKNGVLQRFRGDRKGHTGSLWSLFTLPSILSSFWFVFVFFSFSLNACHSFFSIKFRWFNPLTTLFHSRLPLSYYLLLSVSFFPCSRIL